MSTNKPLLSSFSKYLPETIVQRESTLASIATESDSIPPIVRLSNLNIINGVASYNPFMVSTFSTTLESNVGVKTSPK